MSNYRNYYDPEVYRYQKWYRKKFSVKRSKVQRNCYLKKTYGITQIEYTSLLQKQHGVCKICKTKRIFTKRLAIDHNHKTGKIRGILCFWCNTKLGWFERYKKSILLYA